MKTDGSDQNAKGRELVSQQREVATLRGELQKMTAEFGKALAGKITPERMTRIVLTAVQTTPKLADCSRVSLFGAIMQSCQLALEPNTPLGQAYLIPRWNGTKKCLECNFQVGYQGILDLAYRTDKYKRITAEIVYEGDVFDYEYGLGAYLHHKPAGKSENPVYVYALYRLQNGGEEFKVWAWEKVMRHAEQFSESYEKSFSPWKSNKESQEAMAKKTVLINLLKYAPKSAEIASAVQTDERVLTAKRVDDGGHTFVAIDMEDVAVPAETAAEGAPGSETEEETPAQGQASAGNGNGGTEKNGDGRTAQGGNAAASGKPAPGNARNGGKNAALFSQDETAALEEQYEREQAARYEGPDFGN
jgi:recombination protein RecT